jgi:hypothetical protein
MILIWKDQYLRYFVYVILLFERAPSWRTFRSNIRYSSGFTTDIVGCWRRSPVESLQSHCIHTLFTGPLVHLFASCHEGPGFNPQGGSGTYVKPGFSCYCCRYIGTFCLIGCNLLLVTCRFVSGRRSRRMVETSG